MAQPGDIVLHDGGHRVVVDVADYGPGDVWAVLRYPDGDPRREFDPDGGDLHLTAANVDTLEVIGHI